jgi:hypothetical protein
VPCLDRATAPSASTAALQFQNDSQPGAQLGQCGSVGGVSLGQCNPDHQCELIEGAQLREMLEQLGQAERCRVGAAGAAGPRNKPARAARAVEDRGPEPAGPPCGT